MYLYIVAGLALLVSLIFSRDKTARALKIAARRFLKIFPAFLSMIVLVSVVLYLVPDELISQYLGTTLMMVGVLTVPIEKAYFGLKVTVIRNVISFFIAIAVAIMIGLFFGEIWQ